MIVGIGVEATRGTPVAPQVYIPARTPSGIAPVLEKTPIKETRGTKIATNASEITQKRAEGDLEFNLRSNSIGYILKSLFGSVVSAPSGSVHTHTFNVLEQNPQHPALTIGLHQPNVQDYTYVLAIASALKIDLTPDDLVKATASFIASLEQEKAGDPYAPTFAAGDVYFRHQDATIKIAANVAGLSGATPIGVKSLNLEISNAARVDQNVSELNPGDVLGLVFEPKGAMELDVQNTDYHDIFADGEYKAMQISLVRSDVELGSGENPSLVITLPRVSFEGWSPNRPIDDIVRQSIDFMVHYDATAEYAIRAVLTNSVEDYDAASES